MKKFLVGVSLMALLAGCSGSTTTGLGNIGGQVSAGVVQVNDAFLNDLTGILNTAGPDIQNAENTMNAILPSTGKAINADMGQCDGALLTIQGDLAAIAAAAKQGTNGAVTAASLAETVIPNGPLYTAEKKILLNGCLSAGLDVLQSQGQLATAAAAGSLIISQLGTIAPVVAAAIP